jgi:hypothetical protein
MMDRKYRFRYRKFANEEVCERTSGERCQRKASAGGESIGALHLIYCGDVYVLPVATYAATGIQAHNLSRVPK